MSQQVHRAPLSDPSEQHVDDAAPEVFIGHNEVRDMAATCNNTPQLALYILVLVDGTRSGIHCQSDPSPGLTNRGLSTQSPA
jgi:hypothetical protein